MRISDWSSDVCASDLPVSVRKALASSLNVPAGRTLVIDGVQQFRDRLWALGYHGIVEDGDYYGFSLALGSAEVSLVEQANAFRTLANQGRWSPVHYVMGDPAGEARRIVAPAAAFIRSEEHTSELQSLMRTSYAVFCLKKK